MDFLMISHRSEKDDENMTYDVSEENKSIIWRRLYVIMRLFCFLLWSYFTIPSSFMNDLFLYSWKFILTISTSRKKINLLFLKETRTELKITNYITSSLNTNIMTKFEKFTIEKRIKDIQNEAKSNCYFFDVLDWMILL